GEQVRQDSPVRHREARLHCAAGSRVRGDVSQPEDQTIMKRRDFLWTLGSAAMMPSIASAQTAGGGTVLYDSRAVALTRVDTNATGALWVLKKDLPRINGFELKPQGACRADICIPIPK